MDKICYVRINRMNVIEVKNLTKFYQVYEKEPGFLGAFKSLFHRRYSQARAVDDISFKIAEGELKGTEAFVNGWPIGDSIGPLVAASFMDNGKEIAEDIVYDKVIINGRICHLFKTTSP